MGIFSQLKKKKSVSVNFEKPVPLALIFPDAKLAECVAQALHLQGVNDTEVMLPALFAIEYLDARGKGIASVAGLEYLLGLKYADLRDNQLTDIPFTIETVERINQQSQKYFSLNKFLSGQVLDLSGNHFSSIPAYIKECREREIHFIADLSDNPFEDTEERLPTAEAVLRYIRNDFQMEFTEQQLQWLLYGVYVWYQTQKKTLICFKASDAYGFEEVPIAFIKTSEETVMLSSIGENTIEGHEQEIINTFGVEPLFIKKEEQAVLKPVIETWLLEGFPPRDPNEPFWRIKVGELLQEKDIQSYYHEYSERLGQLKGDVLSEHSERQQSVRTLQLILKKAQMQTKNVTIQKQFEKIGTLITEITDYIEKHPEKHYVDFDVNYLPMLSDLIRDYIDTEDEFERMHTERTLDTIVEAFDNYKKTLVQEEKMDIFSEADILTSLFRKNGLIEKD